MKKLKAELEAAKQAELDRIAAERDRLLKEAGDQDELSRLAAEANKQRQIAEAEERARKQALHDAEADRLARQAE